MANLLLLLLLLTITVLIILMSVSVRFIYFDEPIIIFDFLLFSFLLFPSSNKRIKKEDQTNIQKTAKNKLAKASSLKKSLDYLLKRSAVKIKRIDLKLANTEPANFVLQEKNISTLIFILITYLSLKTGNLITEDTHFISYGENDAKTHIDITLTSTLFHILIAIFIFSKENAKKKRKRAKRIVRKQNE